MVAKKWLQTGKENLTDLYAARCYQRSFLFLCIIVYRNIDRIIYRFAHVVCCVPEKRWWTDAQSKICFTVCSNCHALHCCCKFLRYRETACWLNWIYCYTFASSVFISSFITKLNAPLGHWFTCWIILSVEAPCMLIHGFTNGSKTSRKFFQQIFECWQISGFHITVTSPFVYLCILSGILFFLNLPIYYNYFRIDEPVQVMAQQNSVSTRVRRNKSFMHIPQPAT